MKFKLVESIDDRLVEYKKSREWTDEEIRDIIDMYTRNISAEDIAAKYNVGATTIRSKLKSINVQPRNAPPGLEAKKYLVYLNTISYIDNITDSRQLSLQLTLEYKPSIKLGYYTLSEINQISSNLRRRISNKREFNGSEAFAFYMKLLKEGNIKQLISDILNIDKVQVQRIDITRAKSFKLLTVDDTNMIREADLVEFYSFKNIAEDRLADLGSRIEEWAEPISDSGKYLKELALEYYTPTIGNKDYTKSIEQYGINNIIYLLFDKHGNRIDPINYKKKINEIPYEDEFIISSLEDLKKCFRDYKKTRDVLYGYLDNKSRVVYVGITQNAYSRGDAYVKSDREKRLIARALTTNLINKLIIFKSYLPTAYSESSSKLLRQLEIEFAEKIFKTYHPENKNKSFDELIESGTLNIDKPGKNQSRYIVKSIENYVAVLAANSLLSPAEYKEKLISTFGNDIAEEMSSSRYSYKKFYLSEYIKNHENSWKSEFLLKDVGHGKSKYLYPNVTLDELNKLMREAGFSTEQQYTIKRCWETTYNKNNQDNTNDLDDNINGDDYK